MLQTAFSMGSKLAIFEEVIFLGKRERTGGAMNAVSSLCHYSRKEVRQPGLNVPSRETQL